ncbi:MAG: TonB-dependent receptor plug domain-containing protein [Tannerella sp.]|nr:TonB-dependent receptor plug domain-containing protein [Tannerella sp.]
MNLKKLAKKTIASLLLSMLSIVAFAQEHAVTGTVIDELGDPVTGANVVVVGTTNGTITDIDGNFSLSVAGTAKQLEISFIGMQKEVVNIVFGTPVHVTLKENAELLDEVVVIGYQTVRRRDLTGSVASIKGDAISASPVTNVAQALQGKLPGVNVMSQDGRPDATISIRVRGGGSISQSNDPLVLIDGIPGTISDIPGDMVESIDVLKDASSTAIYGARGANGVILVTTKKGKEDKATVSYSGYAKFNTPTGLYGDFRPIRLFSV